MDGQLELQNMTYPLYPLIFKFKTGNFMTQVGTDEKIRTSKPSVSRCVERFCLALKPHFEEFIKFPKTEEEVRKTQEDFHSIAGILKF